MKVNIQDVLFWMDAIRDSDDRYRTLESFWKGQVNSKVWLAENLIGFVPVRPLNIVIYGGWNGVLASILFNSNIAIQRITSVDIDPVCEDIANTVNRRYVDQSKFTAITADMTTVIDESADVVINTSCEHITQEQYDKWLNNQPNNATIVLQSNNYFNLDEHIRCSTDLEDFVRMSNINPYLRKTLETLKYDRYMLIGKKNV
jgi:hypothetical protein|tara:strand:+ start:307 stop:912 length:606 start_codon:yes stop_codon:yes gene_type:complete